MLRKSRKRRSIIRKKSNPKKIFSRRKSRKRRPKVKWGMENANKTKPEKCNPKTVFLNSEEKIKFNEVIKLISFSLVENQNKINNNYKFSFGKRSKTKYTEKAVKSLSDSFIIVISNLGNKFKNILTRRNVCRIVVVGGTVTALCTDEVQNLISSTIINNSNLETFSSIVDVGISIGNYEKTDYINIILNSIGFSLSMGLDWWFYLITPLGFSMLTDLFNKDPRQVLIMLLHASFMGVEPKSILRWVSSMRIEVCRTGYDGFVGIIGKIERMENIAVNFVINRILFELSRSTIEYTYSVFTNKANEIINR